MYNHIRTLWACIRGLVGLATPKTYKHTGKEYKPAEGLKTSSTGDPFVDWFLINWGP